MKPRYYYHLTQASHWGKEIILTPRVKGWHRADWEPYESRTCVGPTVYKCLTALGNVLTAGEKIYVYRTAERVLGFQPYDIVDARITGERWLKRKTKFKRVGEIDLAKLPARFFNCNVGSPESLRAQQRLLQLLESIGPSLIIKYE